MSYGISTQAPSPKQQLTDDWFKIKFKRGEQLLETVRRLKNEGFHISYRLDDTSPMDGGPQGGGLHRDYVQLYDSILLTYAYHWPTIRIKQEIPTDMNPKVVWIPHCAGPEFLHMELNETAIRDRVLLIDRVRGDLYPTRQYLANKKQNNPHFPLDIYSHPGWHFVVRKSQTENFANGIHSYLSSITCASTQYRMVAKIFEVMATGALLIFEDSLKVEMKSLGFNDGEHYKSYDKYSHHSVINAIRWAITPTNRKIDSMRRNAQKVVHENHQCGHRVHAMMAFYARGDITYPFPITNHLDDEDNPSSRGQLRLEKKKEFHY